MCAFIHRLPARRRLCGLPCSLQFTKVKDAIRKRNEEKAHSKRLQKEQAERDAESRRKEKDENHRRMTAVFDAQRQADADFIATFKDKKERDALRRDLDEKQRKHEQKARQDEARRIKIEMLTKTRTEMRKEAESKNKEMKANKAAAKAARLQRAAEHEKATADRKKMDKERRKADLRELARVQEEEDKLKAEKKLRAEEDKRVRAETKERNEREKRLKLENEKRKTAEAKAQMAADLQRQAQLEFQEAIRVQKEKVRQARGLRMHALVMPAEVPLLMLVTAPFPLCRRVRRHGRKTPWRRPGETKLPSKRLQNSPRRSRSVSTLSAKRPLPTRPRPSCRSRWPRPRLRSIGRSHTCGNMGAPIEAMPSFQEGHPLVRLWCSHMPFRIPKTPTLTARRQSLGPSSASPSILAYKIKR